MHVELPGLIMLGAAAGAFLMALLPARGVPEWFPPALGAWIGASVMLGLAGIGFLGRLVGG